MNRWPATPPPTSSPANATRSWSAAAASCAAAQVAGLAYGAKPDHQSTYAQLVIRRDGAQARVWIGLNSTIWDSNGDAKSRVVTDAAAYQDLFARLDQALKTPARQARSPGKPQLPTAAVCIAGYIRAPPAPCQTSSTRPAHAPASCLVLYGSYR